MADGREPKAEDGPPRLRPTVVVGPATSRSPSVRSEPTQAKRPRPSTIPPRPAEPLVLPEPNRTPLATKSALTLPLVPPSAAAAGPSQVTRPPLAPTAIRGEAPRRVEMSAADFARLAPGSRPAIREQALALARGVVLDRSAGRRALLWGHDLQREHGALASRGLDLVRSEDLVRVTAHLSRLTTILSGIDVEAATGATCRTGLLGGLLRGANARIDTPDELARSRAEIEQILALLGEALPRLLQLKVEIEAHWRRLEALAGEAEALALAAEVLSLHLQPANPELACAYLDRGLALTQTVAQVRSNAGLREAQVEQPLRLIKAIQDVALVALPGWLGAIAAFEAAAVQRRATPTQAGELAHRLRGILQTLNP